MSEKQRDRMSKAIRAWLVAIESEPGWKEWRRKRISNTLYFDDPFPLITARLENAFVFSDEIEKQHAVVIQYLGLQQTIYSLSECQYYFRRFPFRSLPITRYNHLTNVCEMFFGRFYEFRERMKAYFKAIENVSPDHGLEIGQFIKLYDKLFDQELRERHSINHRNRFEDLALDRVFLTESLSMVDKPELFKRQHMSAYRKLVGEWVQRVQRRSLKMEEVLEAIAQATLSSCGFLSSRISEK